MWSLPRVSLAHLPTPVESLPRLTGFLGGPRILIKRDDLTGLAGGGNKTRKLELLVADALDRGAESLITVGGAQSNHCRQTAAAAAKQGLRCILVLRGDPPTEVTGNILLDRLLGAEIHWAGERDRQEVMDEIVGAELAAGRKPYPIPLGGSNGIGSSAYALALRELLEQTRDRIDWIVFASSSGGTHGGLVAGADALGFAGRLLGISIDEELDSLRSIVAGIAGEVSERLDRPRVFKPDDVLANADYVGAGYGVMGEPEREAIRLLARLEGILLDPVYTGRAAAGMIDLIRKRFFRSDETVVFWHTGGTPALFAYATELLHSR